MAGERIESSGYRRPAAGLAIGLGCFLLIAIWLVWVWLEFDPAEVAAWVMYLSMALPTVMWGLISTLLGISIALGRKKEATILGSLVAAVIFSSALVAVLHFAIRWPF